MVRQGKFGIIQNFNGYFDQCKFNHNTRDDLAWRIILQDLELKGDWLSYIRIISNEFHSLVDSDRIVLLHFQIQKLEDLTTLLNLVEYRRWVKDEQVYFPTDKISKRTTQLQFDIANRAITIQSKIILILQKSTTLSNADKIQLVEFRPKSPICKPHFVDEIDHLSGFIQKVEPKKKTSLWDKMAQFTTKEESSSDEL